jgi:micrococcal nuclease
VSLGAKRRKRAVSNTMNKLSIILITLLIASAAHAQEHPVLEEEMWLLPFETSEYLKKERKIYQETFKNPSFKEKTYRVEKVIDGRTLKLSSGEEVRLIGIELPDGREEEVKNFLEQLGKTEDGGNLSGKEVKLDMDIQQYDNDGRLLAYVWYERSSQEEKDVYFEPSSEYYYNQAYKDHPNGQIFISQYKILLNATMIKSGYATFIPSETNAKYAELFQKLYEEARENKRGLWADPSSDKPRLTGAVIRDSRVSLLPDR